VKTNDANVARLLAGQARRGLPLPLGPALRACVDVLHRRVLLEAVYLPRSKQAPFFVRCLFVFAFPCSACPAARAAHPRRGRLGPGSRVVGAGAGDRDARCHPAAPPCCTADVATPCCGVRSAARPARGVRPAQPSSRGTPPLSLPQPPPARACDRRACASERGNDARHADGNAALQRGRTVFFAGFANSDRKPAVRSCSTAVPHARRPGSRLGTGSRRSRGRGPRRAPSRTSVGLWAFARQTLYGVGRARASQAGCASTGSKSRTLGMKCSRVCAVRATGRCCQRTRPRCGQGRSAANARSERNAVRAAPPRRAYAPGCSPGAQLVVGVRPGWRTRPSPCRCCKPAMESPA